MSGEQNRHRRLVYGRRQGHKLRERQQHLMDTLLPGLKVDLDHLRAEGPASRFDHPVSQVWVEIGFGGAEHLVWQAEQNPDVGIIGCEPFINGVAKLLSQVDDVGLRNVRVHDDDARDLLEALPDESVDRIFLLYPDPWPKLRHHKRRFISDENLDRFSRVLRDNGVLRFSSDIPDYVRWTLEHIHRHDAFHWTAQRPDDWRVRPEDWPQTRYERKALDAGRVPAYLTFIRRARS